MLHAVKLYNAGITSSDLDNIYAPEGLILFTQLSKEVCDASCYKYDRKLVVGQQWINGL